MKKLKFNENYFENHCLSNDEKLRNEYIDFVKEFCLKFIEDNDYNTFRNLDDLRNAVARDVVFYADNYDHDLFIRFANKCMFVKGGGYYYLRLLINTIVGCLEMTE